MSRKYFLSREIALLTFIIGLSLCISKYLYILMYSRHFLGNWKQFIQHLSIIFLSPDGEDLDEIFSKHERFSENILQLFLTLRKHEKENKLQENIGKIFPFFLIIFECGVLLQQSELLFLAVNNTETADNYKNLFYRKQLYFH